MKGGGEKLRQEVHSKDEMVIEVAAEAPQGLGLQVLKSNDYLAKKHTETSRTGRFE